ncbi:MAG: hypothetical protein CM1200mP29_16090 [Verrucomicrobiota bacterium]|nr:MAG: hypothetical protein CM1200mP29_16090 [Verrucomicrobiota bacterium]
MCCFRKIDCSFHSTFEHFVEPCCLYRCRGPWGWATVTRLNEKKMHFRPSNPLGNGKNDGTRAGVHEVLFLGNPVCAPRRWLGFGLAKPGELPQPRLAKFRAEVEPVLKRVCVGCHGPEKQKGKFRVDTLNPDLLSGKDVKWWLEVFDVIGNGEMPPEDADARLADSEKAQIVGWLSGEIQVASEVRRSEQGHTSFRRLTGTSIGTCFRICWEFPTTSRVTCRRRPPSEDGFKNSSEMLQMTGVQFQQYRELARKALERATVRGPTTETGLLRNLDEGCCQTDQHQVHGEHRGDTQADRGGGVDGRGGLRAAGRKI